MTVYAAMPMPETYWDSTVAWAAPVTPSCSPATSHRSSAMFSTTDTARKASGTVELPSDRSSAAKKLYRKMATSPAKMTVR